MNEPIAIIGIGCRFPGGANDPESFWKLLTNGVDAVTEVPRDRWDADAFYDPDPTRPGKTNSRWGGFLKDVNQFDYQFFGVSPREAAQMDPQQRLLLEVAWEALEDAGQVLERLAGSRTGVFVGVGSTDYGNLQFLRTPVLQDPYAVTGIALSLVANHLSYSFDFRGPSVVVDTACSASLVAIHLACQSLKQGECELVLAGGVNLILTPSGAIGFTKAGMMSPSGRCKAFDAAADGFVRAEGAGIIVLKPLTRAVADGDPIYGVIRGTAVNQDGYTPLGIKAPSQQAQEAILRDVYERAGISPGRVQYIEAHGTGTALGDPIEAQAIGAALSANRPSDKPLLIGSFKTNIGHLETAAGIAGLIKVALMLRHRMIPPSLHFHKPNPAIPFEQLSLRVQTALGPWPDESVPLIAGVNAFGFGGTNAHVVLEEAPRAARGEVDESTHRAPESPRTLLVPVSARSPEALRALAGAYVSWLSAEPNEGGCALPDIAYAASIRRSHHDERLAVSAHSRADLVQGLQAYLAGEGHPNVSIGRKGPGGPPKLAFVCSGQGPQWWAMGRQLLEQEPIFREAIEQCDALMRRDVTWSLLDELTADEASSRLDQTALAQPALFALQVGLAALWRSWGIVPDAVVGHSVGEVTAAYLSGALSLPEAVRVIVHRGRVMQHAAGHGKMAAVPLSEADVQPSLRPYAGRIVIAAVNSPSSVTLSGDAEAMEELATQLEARGISPRFLRVNCAFHSHHMAPFERELMAALEGLTASTTTIPMISTMTGERCDGEQLNAGHWSREIREPVRFARAIETLLRDGYRIFVEVSAHPVLSGSIAQCAAAMGETVTTVPSLRRQEPERAVMLAALGTLFTVGYPVDWARHYPLRHRFIRLPSYPWQRERCWLDDTPAGSATGIEQALRGRNGAPRHPLLGQRFSAAHRAGECCWQLTLDRRFLSYVDHHRVQGAIILPATVYIEMALAAAAETSGDRPFVLTDIELRKALFVLETGVPIVQVIVIPTGPHEASFHIYSRPEAGAPPDESWTLHVTGTIQYEDPDGAAASQLQIALEEIRARCTQELPIEGYYQRLREIGLDDGPLFQGLEQLWRHDGEAVAKLRLPQALETEAKAYRIHPVLLDAAFHALIGATIAPEGDGDGAARVYLPVHVGRVRMVGRPSLRAWSHAVVRERCRDTFEGDVWLLDESGRVVVEVEGLRLQRLEREVQSRGPDNPDAWLYTVQWQPKPHPGQRLAQEPLDMPTPTAIAARLRPEVVAIQAQEQAQLQAAQRPIEALSVAFFVKALRQLGWQPQMRERVSAAALTAQLGVAVQHRRLLGRILDILEEEDVLRTVGSELEVCHLPDVGEDLQARCNALVVEQPLGKEVLTFVGRCGARLAEVLRGTCDPLELLFPGGSLTDLEAFYARSPFLKPYNTVLQKAIAIALERVPKGRMVRIVELGAGTGGMTSAVLPVLTADRTDYVFTDISALFTSRAQHKFRQFPFVRYALLDIEQDPRRQGFAPHSFDVVLAANVLHATSDLRRTLAHVQQLLAPDGLLALFDATKPFRWADLIFGMMEGWWKFTDTALRPAHALLTQGAWCTLLAEMGFTDVVGIADPAPGEEDPWQAIVLARGARIEQPAQPAVTAAPAPESSGSWLVFADRRGVGRTLAERLTARGDRCVVVEWADQRERVDDDHVRIRLGQPEDLHQLVEAIQQADQLPCRGIVHFWSLDAPAPEDTTAASLEETQRLGSISVLHLVQALARAGLAHPPRLWLVTSTAQAVGVKPESLSIAQSPLWGLGKTIPYEHPELRCTMVDLDREPLEDVELLLEELLSDDRESQLALRDGARYVARVVRHIPNEVRDPAAARRPFEPARDQNFRLDISKRGMLDTLIFRVVPHRPPGPDEVEIQVCAVGLNFRDIIYALALIPDPPEGPVPLGYECAGRIVAVGERVEEFRVGDEVLAMAPASFSAFTTTLAAAVVHKPPHLSFEQAAALPTCFVTAYYALVHLGRLAKGERVLIHAAAGGVGLAAVQIAQSIGADIFATAGSPAKREFLQALGVRQVMDSRSLAFADEVMERTGGRGVDVVLNALSGEFIPKSLSVLASYGRFLEIGKRDIFENSQLGLRPFHNNLSFFAVDVGRMLQERPAVVGSLLREVIQALREGTIRPLPLRVFPLSEVADAFRYMAQAKHIGKIVLAVEGQEVLVESSTEVSPSLRADRTYLITGGLGGLGLAVAQWMLQQGARHLVLMGRHGPSPATEDAMNAMRQAGATVVVAEADVAREDHVARVLADLRQSMPPLAGIVHAAGILDDGMLSDLDEARFMAVMASKVSGSWNLHAKTCESPLDFFVLFSSGVALLGSPGQANYVAASTFLDALAHHRHAEGLPALSINWGAWTQIGLAARPDRGERLALRGLGGMTPTQGLEVFGRLLRQRAPQVGVLSMNWHQWREFYPRAGELLLEHVLREETTPASQRETLTRERIFAADLVERQGLLESYLREQVAKVLGLSPSKLDVQQPLNKVGLDSLMAVELKNRIEVELGVVVPTVELLEGPSIAQLATRILASLSAPASPTPEPAGSAATASEVEVKDGRRHPLTKAEAEQLLARRNELSPEKVDALLSELSADEQKE